jgi:hypothetical protein
MGKKNANNAIDFARLFAVKEQVARRADESTATAASEALPTVPTEPEVVLRTDVGATDERDADAGARPASETSAKVLAFPTAAPSEAEPAVLPVSLESSSTGRADFVQSDRDIFLRIGMTRELHDRLRASAALQGKSVTVYVRDALEASTPMFDTSARLADLARIARAAAPVGSAGPRRSETRMQVPATEVLHRRLVQMAALRSQTLAASLLDLLETQVPAM